MESGAVELIMRFFVLIVSLSIHEFAHAWSAFRLGDDTAARMGRMTLNPLSHLDPIGSLLILTGMPLGWAKPVPVDFARLRDPRRDGSLVALAGPVSNIVLGILCAAVLGLLHSREAASWGAIQLLGTFIQINFGLAIFNLLPLYPLDGSKVVPLFLSHRAADKYEGFMTRLGFWPLLVLFVPAMLGLKGPLNLWFELWMPIIRPVLGLFGVSSLW